MLRVRETHAVHLSCVGIAFVHQSQAFVRAILFLFVVLLTSCTDPETPTLLVHGGTIITMEDARPEVEAMAVQNGRIVAVGTFEEVAKAYPDAERYDVQGQTVLPGIIDSHVHAHELGHDRRKANLMGAETVDAMIERLQTRYPDPTPGTWLVGAGWDEGVWGSLGYPDRAALDAAFPDNPVALESLHGFAGFYNAAALTRAGVDDATPEPVGGSILRRDDGTPTGVMLMLGQRLINQHIPPETLEQTKEAIAEGLRTLAAAGVTSVHEAGIGPQRLAAFQALAEAGELPIRVYGMLDGNNAILMDEWFAQGPQVDPDDWFTVRSIKVFYDGSLGSRTALLAAPYADEPNTARATERITPEAVAALAERAAATGFQMAVHAIGDEGNNRVLDLYDAALTAHPELDHRWRIEHAQVVLPDFYERAASARYIASMQPSHAVGDSKWAEDRVGPRRIQHAYAWRTMLNAGVPLIFNSDLPGEPWEPMQTLYFGVTRQTLDGTPSGGWYPEQATTPEETLHAMTLASAHAAFQDASLGSLAVGKWADFIVVDANPLSTPPADLADISVTATWVAGERVE